VPVSSKTEITHDHARVQAVVLAYQAGLFERALDE
jgi:hypothetical protein